jgi:hypothetical protein
MKAFVTNTVFKGCDDDQLCLNKCNLNPWDHYSSIIEMTLLLDRKYKLNLPERLSLLRAMAVTPNTAYIFVAAASSMLQQGKLDSKHQKGYRFGFLLASMMMDS